MVIGMVYDLRDDYRNMGYQEEQIAECDFLETIIALESTLIALGYQVEKVGNIYQLVQQLAKGKRWDLVFNIAEGLHGSARESQVPALLDAYQIPYTFSPTDVMALSLNKALTKQVVMLKAIPTPDFVVIRNTTECAQVTLPFPLFAKPLSEGTSKGISQRSLVQSQKELATICEELLQQFSQPVLVETFLPGREFTVGILGSGKKAYSIGAQEVLLKTGAESCGHTYQNKENCETLVEYCLATDAVAKKAEKIALDAWQALGCLDAGRVDLRCDTKGNPFFLEVNPLAGLHPTHSDLPILAALVGLPYEQLIQAIVNSAMQRMQEKHRTTCHDHACAL